MRADLIKYVCAYVRRDIDDSLHKEIVAAYDEQTTTGVGSLVYVYAAVDLLEKATDLEKECESAGRDLQGQEP